MFIEKLKAVKARPGMYLAEPTLGEAISFVSGMDYMNKRFVLHQAFSKWICSKKLNIKSAVVWQVLAKNYIEQQGIDTKKQAEAFFDLIFEFLEDQSLLNEGG